MTIQRDGRMVRPIWLPEEDPTSRFANWCVMMYITTYGRDYSSKTGRIFVCRTYEDAHYIYIDMITRCQRCHCIMPAIPYTEGNTIVTSVTSDEGKLKMEIALVCMNPILVTSHGWRPFVRKTYDEEVARRDERKDSIMQMLSSWLDADNLYVPPMEVDPAIKELLYGVVAYPRKEEQGPESASCLCKHCQCNCEKCIPKAKACAEAKAKSTEPDAEKPAEPLVKVEPLVHDPPKDDVIRYRTTIINDNDSWCLAIRIMTWMRGDNGGEWMERRMCVISPNLKRLNNVYDMLIRIFIEDEHCIAADKEGDEKPIRSNCFVDLVKDRQVDFKIIVEPADSPIPGSHYSVDEAFAMLQRCKDLGLSRFSIFEEYTKEKHVPAPKTKATNNKENKP